MALETAPFLNDLVSTNPPGGDLRSQGDDHIRLIKGTLKASFPNITFAKYIEQARLDVADAATPALWAAASDYINLLGTTTITGFVSGTSGQRKLVRFNAARTLTHNASTLQLPSGASITTVAGDHALFQCEGTTNNLMIAYWRATGQPIVSVFPSQTGNAGKVLGTDGTNVSWGFAPPTGAVLGWPLAAIPSGYLLCNGQTVLRSSPLGVLLAGAYGPGDGSTTYNIPDYQGEGLRMTDGGTGRDPDAAGRTNRGDGTTGNNVGTRQGSQFVSHTHFVLADVDVAAGAPPDPTNSTQVAKANTNHGTGIFDYKTAGTATAATVGPASLSGGNETRMRNVYINWIIKT